MLLREMLIAYRKGVAMRTITSKIDALREQRKDTSLKLLDEGITYQSCAEQVGVSITTVLTTVRKHGIHRKSQKSTSKINPNRPKSQKKRIEL
jgi:transposase-like protein